MPPGAGRRWKRLARGHRCDRRVDDPTRGQRPRGSPPRTLRPRGCPAHPTVTCWAQPHRAPQVFFTKPRAGPLPDGPTGKWLVVDGGKAPGRGLWCAPVSPVADRPGPIRRCRQWHRGSAQVHRQLVLRRRNVGGGLESRVLLDLVDAHLCRRERDQCGAASAASTRRAGPPTKGPAAGGGFRDDVRRAILRPARLPRPGLAENGGEQHRGITLGVLNTPPCCGRCLGSRGQARPATVGRAFTPISTNRSTPSPRRRPPR